MSITASKYINNSDSKNSYVGLFHYRRPARGKKEEPLDIYGLLSVSSEVEISGQRISKFAWDGIIDGFEYSKVDSTNESLKLGLKEGVKRIKQLIKNDRGIGEYGINIDFTIFISNGVGIYIGLIGDSEIYIYKDGRLVDITDMLKTKKAKTAAIAVEEEDFLFCSTKGVLKRNIHKLIAAKNRIELTTSLEEIGNEINEGEGIVAFLKEGKVEKEVSKLEKTEVKKETVKKKEKSVEPKDSDYVPTTKEKKSVFKSQNDERDLKAFFVNIFDKLSQFISKAKKGLKPLKGIFLTSLKSISSLLKKIYGKIGEKFGKKRWFKKTAAKISQSRMGKKREGEFKSFKIDGYKEKNLRVQRFKTLGFVFLGVVLLVLGVKFTLDQKRAREISRNANEIFVEVEELVAQAQSKLSTDRDASTVSIFKASEQLKKVEEDLREKEAKKLEELETQVLGIQDTLFKIERLSIDTANIQKFYDTYNSETDSRPSDIGIYRDVHFNEYLLISDLGLKIVSKLSIYNKELSTIPDTEGIVKEPQYVYMKKTGLFIFDSVNGILKSSLTDEEFDTFAKLSGLGIQNIGAKDPVEFAVLTVNENAYILDREQKTLLKSSNFGSGYGLSFPYVTDENFVQANDVLSDLSVYILASGEKAIYRYVNSASEGRLVESPITIKGLEGSIKDAKYGFTPEDLNKSLYIFDAQEKRILRFEKPMESGDVRHPNELHLLKQYLLPQDGDLWNKVRDFVVDWDEKYLYILDGTTIWKITL